MKIEYTKKEIPKYHTDTKPNEYEIILKANGLEFEIDWLLKQLNKIGKNNKNT